MLCYRKSERTITVESYVTLRSEWPEELARAMDPKYVARGFRVVDGHTEWQYFDDDEKAKAWAEGVHSSPTNC